MGRLLTFVFVLFAVGVHAQQVNGKVVDALTNKPLGYASVSVNHQSKLFYTDSLGVFSLNKDSVDKNDSIYIQYIGYKRLPFPVEKLEDGNIFKMVQESQELQPIVVTNCHKFKEYNVNRRVGRIKDYIGPGPETKFVIIGRYLSQPDAEGYIKQLEIYTGNFSQGVRVPVRVHWYGWDTLNNMPGKELTSSNILVYPYTPGWNSFLLPPNAIYFSGGGIVIGLEFIYPVEYMQQYNSISSVNEKTAWLMNMSNRWSIGIQATKDAAQTGFYQVNNLAVRKYNSRGRGLFIKPALRFTVIKCME